MKKVLHISSECYPAAKAGGMGDVVGALPIFLNKINVAASVIIPKYKTKWFKDKKFKTIFKSAFQLANEKINYKIQILESKALVYPFYCVAIPGKFDRASIYFDVDGHGYKDEPERNIAFQLIVLDWLKSKETKFDVLHCHDHMTGLMPFFIKHSQYFESLKKMSTVFTIHNGAYRGIFDWEVAKYFPKGNQQFNGWLDWDGKINSLATAIKCADKVTTVSPAYMNELMQEPDTLKSLYESEAEKCVGILNGIDNTLWNPENDVYLDMHLKNGNYIKFKTENKRDLLNSYHLKSRKPLLSFIGRFAHQKGVDVFISALNTYKELLKNFSIIILGSGNVELENQVKEISMKYKENIAAVVAYDEIIARKIYAASDFMLIPSRFEPCGLNQLYCMRYGTIPIVTKVGGLKDSVPDVSNDGNGFNFEVLNEHEINKVLNKALSFYKNKSALNTLRNKIMNLDFSWTQSAKKYKVIYEGD